jgi:crotonobetainyl-CoA:carnitine CoA-transferase CaiB-like acyl-CoA transferase
MSHEAGQRTHWECKDGYISFFLMGGLTGAPTNQALVEYMDSEGMAPQFMKDMNWREFSHAAQSREFFDKIADAAGKFFKTKTKQELYAEAVKRRMTLYPLNDPKDVTMDAQLDTRGFWEEIDDPDLGTVKYPGAPVKFSETPCSPRRRAPRLGEHNREIYIKELGLSENELAALKKSGVI